MSIIITNVSNHSGRERVSEYLVRINNGPVLGRFEHFRADGLAECLRRAAGAVEAAGHPNPFAQELSHERP